MRDSKGRFLKGNRMRVVADKLCANFPFCKNPVDKRKNKEFCGPYCKVKASKYRIRNNLVKIGKKTA